MNVQQKVLLLLPVRVDEAQQPAQLSVTFVCNSKALVQRCLL